MESNKRKDKLVKLLINKDFNVVELKERILDNEVDSIDKLHDVNNLINKKGLKQIATVSIAIKKFFYYVNKNVKSFDELPQTAQDYIHYIEKYLGIEVYLVSVGPERSQNIIRTTLF